MNKLSLTSMLLLSLALIGYYSAHRQNQVSESKKKRSQERLLFRTSQKNVYQIEISKHGLPHSRILLKKGNGTWNIEHPRKAQADPAAITRLLSSIEQYRFKLVAHEKPKNLEDYGLGRPWASITLWTQGKPPQKINIGSTTPVGYGIYLSRNSEPKVFIGSAYLKLIANQDVYSLRSKSVAEIESQNLARLEIQRGNHLVLKVAKRGRTFISDNGNQPVVQKKVHAFLDKINELRVEGFLRPPYSGNASQAFSNNPNTLTVRWENRAGESHRILLARDKAGYVFASKDPAQEIFQLPRSSVNILRLQELNFFEHAP